MSVVLRYLDSLDVVTSVEGRAVEVGNGSREINLSNCGTVLEYVVAEGNILSTLENVDLAYVCTALECAGANGGGGAGNLNGTNLSDVCECIVADSVDSCVLTVNDGVKVGELCESISADCLYVSAVAEGYGLDIACVRAGRISAGSKCIITDNELTDIESAVCAALEDDGLSTSEVRERLSTYGKIGSAVTLEGYADSCGTACERLAADYLNVSGNYDAGYSTTALAPIS